MAARTRISIPMAYVPALERFAQAQGLDLDAYVTGLLVMHAMGAPFGTSASGGTGAGAGAGKNVSKDKEAPKAGPGRPIAVPEDVPPAAVRDASESGYEGVTRDGRWWKARIGRAAVGGKFSAPEPAAIARYYAHLGFKIGRAAFFGTKGWTVEDAIDMAARQGFAPLASGIDMAADVPPPVLPVPPVTGEGEANDAVDPRTGLYRQMTQPQLQLPAKPKPPTRETVAAYRRAMAVGLAKQEGLVEESNNALDGD